MTVICGYCVKPAEKPLPVRINAGAPDVPLCSPASDMRTSCFELVVVYDRPLADGRRPKPLSPMGQLRFPYFLPGDEKVIAMCGCKGKINYIHMIGCPVWASGSDINL